MREREAPRICFRCWVRTKLSWTGNRTGIFLPTIIWISIPNGPRRMSGAVHRGIQRRFTVVQISVGFPVATQTAGRFASPNDEIGSEIFRQAVTGTFLGIYTIGKTQRAFSGLSR